MPNKNAPGRRTTWSFNKGNPVRFQQPTARSRRPLQTHAPSPPANWRGHATHRTLILPVLRQNRTQILPVLQKHGRRVYRRPPSPATVAYSDSLSAQPPQQQLHTREGMHPTELKFCRSSKKQILLVLQKRAQGYRRPPSPATVAYSDSLSAHRTPRHTPLHQQQLHTRGGMRPARPR